MRVLSISCVIFFTLSFTTVNGDDQPTPSAAAAATVERLTRQILSIDARFGVRGETAFAARHAAYAPLIDATHDLLFMARLTVRRQWHTFDPEQRTRFIDAFRELTITAYAARYRGLDGVRFASTEARSMPRGRVEIRTTLIDPADDDVRFSYVLHATDDGWRIVNITADGVSELALKRGQFSRVLADGGAAALLERLAVEQAELRASAL